MYAQELFGLVTPGKAVNDIFRLCAPESVSLPLKAIRPAMMSFWGAVSVLLAVGLAAPGVAAPPGAVAAECAVVGVAVGVAAPLDAAGCDELQAATPATSIRMAAGTPRLNSADVAGPAGLGVLIMNLPAIFFLGS